MQRLIIRLSAVGALLTVGVAAIVQAQFRANPTAVAAGEQAAATPDVATSPKVPQPIPPGPSEEEPTPLVPPTADAFRPPATPPTDSFRISSTDGSAATERGGARFIDTPRYGNGAAPNEQAGYGTPIASNERSPYREQEAYENPTEDPTGDNLPGGYAGPGSVRPVAGESPAGGGLADGQPTAPPESSAYAVQPPPGGGGVYAPYPAAGPADAGTYENPPEPTGSLTSQPPASGPSQYAVGDAVAGDDLQPESPPGPPAAAGYAPQSSPYGFTPEVPQQPAALAGDAVAAGAAMASAAVGAASQARLSPNVQPIADSDGAYAPPAPQSFVSDTDQGTVPPQAAAVMAAETATPIEQRSGVEQGSGVEPIDSTSGRDRYAMADGAPPAGRNLPGAASADGYPPTADVTASGYAAEDPPPTELPGASGMEGSGTPGERKLEGPQTPSLTIEKVAPPEIQVNRPAMFQIRVRNVGQTAAHQVILVDEVPLGTRLLQATPVAARSPDGALTWQLGTLEPGKEAVIAIELLPLREGDVGSVAQVSFQAEASARTVCTQPKLKLKHSTQPSILIGDRLKMAISLTNEGSGAATGVVIEEDVPDGLIHDAGRELEYEVGTLRPGESKNLELTLRADKAGTILNQLAVRADGDILVEDQIEINIVAPQLKLGVEGPGQRYLERQATYVVHVANDGTAAARDVEVTAHLPRGFKFVSTNNHGRYDPQSHAVLWSLAELPAAAKGSVELTVLPVEMGQHKLRIQGTAALELADSYEHPVAVEGLAALFFQVGDVNDPIPVGSETVYELRVNNTGSKAATNIRLSAVLPEQMKPLSGEGPTRVLVEGQRIEAEAIPRLAPRGEAVYKFRVRGLQPGDQRIRVQLTSDELEAPVIKEESTQVYSDR